MALGRFVVPLSWALVRLASAKSSTPSCCKDNMAYVDESVTGALPNGAFVANARACQTMCEASPSCATFTFKEHGSAAGVWPSVPAGGCYLFKAGKKLKAEEGAISGPRWCEGQKHFKLPFNVSLPESWFPEGSYRKPEKPKEEGPSVSEQMKAEIQGFKRKVKNLEVCDGVRCCPGSTCHYGSSCAGYRGSTRCVGAGLMPLKWGKCECMTGACSPKGLCGDAPSVLQAQQSFEVVEDVRGARKPQHDSEHRVVLVGIAVASLMAALAIRIRSARSSSESPRQVAVQDTLESGAAE